MASRQGVPAGLNPLAGHEGPVPVHFSTASQTPAEALQEVDEERNLSTGHEVEVPLQVSATSQVPAAARQRVPRGAAVTRQVPGPPPVVGMSV